MALSWSQVVCASCWPLNQATAQASYWSQQIHFGRVSCFVLPMKRHWSWSVSLLYRLSLVEQLVVLGENPTLWLAVVRHMNCSGLWRIHLSGDRRANGGEWLWMVRADRMQPLLSLPMLAWYRRNDRRMWWCGWAMLLCVCDE
jgi:hypothetical protein